MFVIIPFHSVETASLAPHSTPDDPPENKLAQIIE